MTLTSSIRTGIALTTMLFASAPTFADGVPAFTKIANDGLVLPDSASLGSGTREWACTRDDQTKLLWEVKTSDGGFRDSKFTYTPYDGNPATNGGWVGYRDTKSGTCIRSLMSGGSCNTEAYVEAVNKAQLCGFSDWRLPTFVELVRIAGERTEKATPVTARAFPNTTEGWYWTGISRIGETAYSRVILLPPGARAQFYDGSYLVRLVRGLP